MASRLVTMTEAYAKADPWQRVRLVVAQFELAIRAGAVGSEAWVFRNAVYREVDAYAKGQAASSKR